MIAFDSIADGLLVDADPFRDRLVGFIGAAA